MLATTVRRLSVIALLLTPIVGLPSTANAIRTTGCVGAATWSFNPPLTTQSRPGTITLTGSLVCGQYDPASGLAFRGGSASQTSSYLGSCTFAVVSGFATGVLIGGTTFVGILGAENVSGVWELVPNSICNQSSATAAGVGAGVI